MNRLLAFVSALTAFIAPLALMEPAAASDTSDPSFYYGPFAPTRPLVGSFDPHKATKAPPTSTGPYAVPAEKRVIPFNGDLAGCEDYETLWWIKNRFDHTEAEFWHSNLQIENFNGIHEIGYRTDGATYIPRRYCVGRVELNDHKSHAIVYQIIERGGIAGYTNGFEWCVLGLDHDLAYAPACIALRPVITRYANEKVTFPTN